MKTCKRCGRDYSHPAIHFSKGDGVGGLRSICRSCQMEYGQKYRKENRDAVLKRGRRYYESNREKLKARSRKYYKEHKKRVKEYLMVNRDKIKETHRLWLKKNKDHIREYSHKRYLRNKKAKREYNREYHQDNMEKLNEKSRRYYYLHKDKIRAYESYRRKTDPCYRIRLNLSRRIRCALKSQNTRKTNKTMDLVGCSLKEFKKHLEDLFTAGMTWNNYGRNGWTIDHIKPCVCFDLTKEQEQKKCFHYKNQQPLWHKINSSKGSRYGNVTMRKRHKIMKDIC